MHIVNLLAKPNLWTDPDIFKPLSGLQIHGQPIGHNLEEIVGSLKLHFGINEKMNVELTSEVNSVLARANTEFLKHFSTSTSTVFIAGIDNHEEFANNNLGGVSGYAWPDAVFLYLNPEREWKDMLFRTTLHEFNHCQRYVHNNPSASFLDWLIFEGLAEDFESELTGVASDYSDHDRIAVQYLPEVKKFWNEMPSDVGDWFFGKPEKNIPFALGYRIGNYLVRAFRQKHPKMTWAELVRLPSSEFAI